MNLPFAHPLLHTPLKTCATGWRCPETGEIFPLDHGVPSFVPSALRGKMDEERTGMLNGLKTFLRKSPRLYVALVYVISPVCFVGLSAKKFLRRFAPGSLILNIGSGVHKPSSDVINVDIFWYKGVDIVGDAHALPFLTNSIDAVVCEYLLEHVPDPKKAVQEFLRVLKPGGQCYLSVPFVYPFHACPNDFYRWSSTGVRFLCEGGDIEIVAPRGGPTSALVAQLGTWAAILFSFGSDSLYSILNVVFMVLFSQLKWLDVVLGRIPTAIHGAESWYVVFRKPLPNA